ncbi:MAG: flavin reductase family protein [Saccharopolyspora sp.]|uniref:flavin reductase family protein n=1 Tax=Saccharopolyspora sp. TaxID=33915 RepID=UPI0025EF2C06|nr:flavin reductase family protein [Saccharopolyspora sp.]MBQ6639990.1 flavin reductase family protein [Saccharopolyspora sp.]
MSVHRGLRTPSVADSTRGLAGDAFKEVAREFPTGITVVAVRHHDSVTAKTVSSFTSLSLDPMLVTVAIGGGSPLVATAEETEGFSVSILRADQIAVSNFYAVHESHRGTSPPSRLVPVPSGGTVLDDCLGWFDCRLHGLIPAGDHAVLIGEVVSLQRNGGTPLVHHRGRYYGLDQDSPISTLGR